MWNNNNCNSEENSVGSIVDFNHLFSGEWRCGLEQFAAAIGYTVDKILYLFEDNDLKLYYLLKYQKNSIKLFSEIEAEELSDLADDYLLQILCAPCNIIELLNVGIELAELNNLKEDQFKLFLNRSSDVKKIMDFGITFDQLEELPLINLKLVLSRVDNFIQLIKKNKITLDEFIKLKHFEIDQKISSLKQITSKSFESTHSIFKNPEINEKKDQPSQFLRSFNRIF